jgi:antitoxin PrlF
MHKNYRSPMKYRKLTSKFQTTIPEEVRKALHLKVGDQIFFQILDDGKVIIKKAIPFDKEYHEALSYTLSEWGSKHDEEDFSDLQDV